MSYRDKVRERVAPHVPPGETYLIAFPAAVGPAAGLPFTHRVVVVTDKGVHLFTAGWWRICDPKRLLASYHPAVLVQAKRVYLCDLIEIAGETLQAQIVYREYLHEAIAFCRRFTFPGQQRNPSL